MEQQLISQIKQLAKQNLDEIIQWRRYFHAHPELSFQEIETGKKIQSFLTDHQITFTSGWAGNGIVATIEGGLSGPAIMLRADMDALPIQEANTTSYNSMHDGIMHACGHDVHMASLMGTILILQEIREKIKGKIQFIFQPGEEKLPGGASIAIREGVLEKYKPSHIIAQHVFPSLPAGHVGFRNGLYMASADEIYITVQGKGGHAATPHQCVDPIPIAARIVTALQEIVTRRKDPIVPAVLTIGKIYSDGGATNVIPDRVLMEGTLRTMDENWRFSAHEEIRQLVTGICQASGATSDIRIEVGYPSLMNDEQTTDCCREAAIQYLGQEKVHDLPLRMTSEDFAFYSRQCPATFYRLGTGWENQLNYPVHSHRFDIDENALETGMGLMAFLALTFGKYES